MLVAPAASGALRLCVATHAAVILNCAFVLTSGPRPMNAHRVLPENYSFPNGTNTIAILPEYGVLALASVSLDRYCVYVI
jgi:hypothetical protein